MFSKIHSWMRPVNHFPQSEKEFANFENAQASNTPETPSSIIELPTNGLSSRRPWVSLTQIRSMFGMRIAAYELKTCKDTQSRLTEATSKREWSKLANFWSRALVTKENTKTQSKAEFLVALAKQYNELNGDSVSLAALGGNKKAIKIQQHMRDILKEDSTSGHDIGKGMQVVHQQVTEHPESGVTKCIAEDQVYIWNQIQLANAAQKNHDLDENLMKQAIEESLKAEEERQLQEAIKLSNEFDV